VWGLQWLKQFIDVIHRGGRGIQNLYFPKPLYFINCSLWTICFKLLSSHRLLRLYSHRLLAVTQRWEFLDHLTSHFIPLSGVYTRPPVIYKLVLIFTRASPDWEWAKPVHTTWASLVYSLGSARYHQNMFL